MHLFWMFCARVCKFYLALVKESKWHHTHALKKIFLFSCNHASPVGWMFASQACGNFNGAVSYSKNLARENRKTTASKRRSRYKPSTSRIPGSLLKEILPQTTASSPIETKDLKDVLADGCVISLGSDYQAVQSRRPLTVAKSQRKSFLNVDPEEIAEIADQQPPHQSIDVHYGDFCVREVVCLGVKVMRRQTDGLTNANQILQAAGIPADPAKRILKQLEAYSDVRPLIVTTGDSLLHGRCSSQRQNAKL
ncbi:hypothetical protein BJ741DRAFT_581088 [Chytriomyces cf. hyalinus JEL632]|nr:hypothetical protein BJ741DRAFT_581088 [Chytriomyces cf. hyalinus JEL632]